MTVEYTIFDAINGWAGRWPILDTLGRLLAVFGLLAVLLLVIMPLWRADVQDRRRYLIALFATAAVFAALIGLELLLTHLLGRELRSRPANARWTTMLITPKTAMAFPCWPVAMSAAASVLLWHRMRALGISTALLTALQAIAFIFVGANYPFDVLTGAALGLVLGHTSAVIFHLSPVLRARSLVLPVILLFTWLGVVAVTVKPASDADTNNIPNGARISARGTTCNRISYLLTGSKDIKLRVDDNGHLMVGSMRITIPGETATLAVIEKRSRDAVNRAFMQNQKLGLLTVTVIGRYGSGSDVKMGTLYTATVDRVDWPAGGFAPTQKLPGEKYVLPRLLAR